jgi:predicted lipoprotein with Yx(FWY)xxD motif
MIRSISIGLVLAALGFIGCGGDDDSDDGGAGTSEAAATTQSTTEATGEGTGATSGPGTTIKTADSQYGQVLFDGSDQAIYFFDKEQGSKSECYGACAEAWPPVTTEGDPQAGTGAKAGLLGTTRRDDGGTQVTYAGRPLYFYVDDPKSQVLCHNVEEFGGLWLAVAPSGDPVS